MAKVCICCSRCISWHDLPSLYLIDSAVVPRRRSSRNLHTLGFKRNGLAAATATQILMLQRVNEAEAVSRRAAVARAGPTVATAMATGASSGGDRHFAKVTGAATWGQRCAARC